MKFFKNLMLWQKHAIVLVLLLIICQPIMSYIYFTMPEIATQVYILILTSNLIILGYAVFTYRIFNEYQIQIENKLRMLGIDPPTLDMLIAKFYEQFKPILDAVENSKLSADDIANLTKALKQFSSSVSNKIDIDAEIKKIDKLNEIKGEEICQTE